MVSLWPWCFLRIDQTVYSWLAGSERAAAWRLMLTQKQ